jgi:hypothetical protein
MKLFLLGCLLPVACCLAVGGCANLADATASLTATTTLSIDVIDLVNADRSPDSAQLIEDATAAQLAAQQVVTDAKSMPTSAEIQQYAAAASEIAQEVIALLQQFHVFGVARLGSPQAGASLTPVDVQAQVLNWRLRVEANPRPLK